MITCVIDHKSQILCPKLKHMRTRVERWDVLQEILQLRVWEVLEKRPCNTHIEFSPLASLCGFLAVLDLCCCAQAFSSGKELGLLFLVVPRLLTEVSSLVEHRL